MEEESLGKKQYYCRLLSQSSNRAYNITGIISAILAIIGGVIVFFCPTWGGTMNFLFWTIPVAVFVMTGIIEFVLGSYWFYKKIESDKNILIEQIKPKLKVLSAGWSDNRGLRGGTWWLKIENEGIEDVESMGILEQMELANPGKDQSMSSYPQSCPLIWGGSNPIPGKCSSMLEIIYREPRTLSNYRYDLAYNNYDKKNIGLPIGMDILMIFAVKSKDTNPLFTVCYFLGTDWIADDKFEVLSSNLRQRPSIADCCEMLKQYKANYRS